MRTAPVKDYGELRLPRTSANTIPDRQLFQLFQILLFSPKKDVTIFFNLFCKKMDKAKAKLCGCTNDLSKRKKTTA